MCERSKRASGKHPGVLARFFTLVLSCLMSLSLAATPARAAVTADQLSSHIVPGLNPANTVVNLFDYDAGVRSGNGTDTLGTTGGATPLINYNTWLGNTNSINYGRLLTFGDGMRHLGYWNQGLVAAYGDVAKENAGMQGIVESTLSEAGYPVVSASETNGYNVNQSDYSTARRKTGNNAAPNEMIYGNAGPLYWSSLSNTVGNTLFDPVWGWNIDPVVQAQALSVAAGSGNVNFSALNNSANPSTQATKNGLLASSVVNFNEGYELPESIRSLQYLFDPATASAGKTSYKNVTGLFQMDADGYYYYNMRDNFAEYVPDPATVDGVQSDGHFVLYDAPAGLRTDGTNSVGNFFPFNHGTAAFNAGADGTLVNALNANNTGNAEAVDHHLGMTVETSFRQPIDGKVGTNDMTFEFAGDDDVWVFIDDVLVLDLGGIHSELYGTINFATGQVCMGPAFDTHGIPENPVELATDKTTIKAMFDAAGKGGEVRWNNDTFASNTSHTLKMFYLERGNYDSSIALRFNLQEALYQQIQKVDQNGNPLAGAEFDLYAAHPTSGAVNTQNSSSFTLDDVETVGGPLTHLVTDSDGIARFTDGDEPFNFSDRYNQETGDGLLYILRETKAPAGYKSTPEDILLRFEPQFTMLVVNNRYQVGAYASFVSHIEGNNSQVLYGQVGEDGGLVTQIPGSDPVDVKDQEDGLVIVVPMLKNLVGGSYQWLPLYGDNLEGFNAVHYDEPPSSEVAKFREQVRLVTLKGGLLQSAQFHNSKEANGWYLTWNQETGRLSGYLENLPGRADRYLLQNPESGDMRNWYALIKPDALMRVLGVSRDELHAMSGDARYAALGAKVAEALAADGGTPASHVQEIMDTINTMPANYLDRGYTPLDIRSFVRNFRSRIYIPNEQRQLRVNKVDQTGVLRNGATFALYSTREDAENNDPAKAVAQGQTATVDGRDGTLIFEPVESHDTNTPGYADMKWPDVKMSDQAPTYYLREVAAPANCLINDNVIEIKVGTYAIYADAGVANDGVQVHAGVGKLAQTMVKYASEGDVNITLRDITAIGQSQQSGAFDMAGWQDMLLPGTGELKVPRSMNLHYGTNAVIDYGLSDEDGGKNYEPFFVTDTGYIRTRVKQNLHEHDDPNDPLHSTAEADDLGDMDITGLFSLVNTVVVTNPDTTKPGYGSLVLSKTVSGEGVTEADFDRLYHFKVELTDSKGNPLKGSYRYIGRDIEGSVTSGDTLPLHHGQQITILGLPVGTTYKVTEDEANKNGFYANPKNGCCEGLIKDEKDPETQEPILAQANFENIRGERPPEEPEDPAYPEEPEDPEDPGDPGTPETPKPNLPDTGSKKQVVPATGDVASLAPWALAGAAALSAAIAKLRRGSKE